MRSLMKTLVCLFGLVVAVAILLTVSSSSYGDYEPHFGETRKAENASAGGEAEHPAGLPAPLANMADDGVFHLYLNEDAIGEMRGALKQKGDFAGTSVLSMAGQEVTIETRITCDEAGIWEEITQEAPTGKVTLTREKNEITMKFKEQTTTYTSKEGMVLFENYSPALMTQVIKAYDHATDGVQKIQVFIIPSLIESCELEKTGEESRIVGGNALSFTTYRFSIHGTDIHTWVDENTKVYFMDVPIQRAAYVRDGFEALMRKPVDDPLLSKPEFKVEETRDKRVAMRDGVKLETDLYLPKTDEKVPVILVRTPYEKNMSETSARYYARRGYAYVIQDCRGRFGSEGTWEPFIHEPYDGYDTIEWIAKQPWCNGKIGMIGGSYLGWVQWWAARENPPHLKTIIPNVAPPDPFYNIPYEYGVFYILGGIWWAEILEKEATADLSGAARQEIEVQKYKKLLMELPVIDLDKKILGKENPYWRRWIEHPTNDAYWEQANFLEHLENVNIPVFHQSGWFDGDGIGSKLNYRAMKSHGHANQKLILGPWQHTDTAHRRLGDLDFGPESLWDLQRDYLRWLDYWLKGIDNGIMKEPLVSIFVMNTNKWLHDETYPLSYSLMTKYYFDSKGKANTSKGDGILTTTPPAKKSPADIYVYDPGDPTLYPSYFERTEEEDKIEKSYEEKKAEALGYHEQVISTREDILVYQTPVLETPLTFAGPIEAVLYASSSAKDTDWFVRLIWNTADGKNIVLGEGKIRARFRKSMKMPKMLKPGEVYEYHIDVWQTGVTIPTGDRLRVEVSSASFPMFSRNLNTGGHNEKDTEYLKATQKIFHNEQYPSHIILPVIPAEKLQAIMR